MKLLVVLFVAIAAGVAVTSAALVFSSGRGGSVSAATAPQNLTMQVVTDDDRMVGPNLVVRPGRIVLTIINYARHAHTFSVRGLGIERVVLPGSPTQPSTTVVKFTAPHGTFTWYCRLPCKHAMSGEIYVSLNPAPVRGPLWATSA